jgi:uncharacterized protein
MPLKKIRVLRISVINTIDFANEEKYICASGIFRGRTYFMEQGQINSFREKLEQHYAWPALYMFKFIVPSGKEDDVKKLFPQHYTSEKLSKNGKYTSITIQMMMPSSDSVIEVYLEVSKIEGLIAL